MGTDTMVQLAQVVKPQGLKGEVIAQILTDFPERFADRKHLFLLSTPPREVELERYRMHKGRVVLKFAGINRIEDAEKLRGISVAIPAEQRQPLEEGAYYVSDLVGLTLVDAQGTQENTVGAITDVDQQSTVGALLVVDARPSGGGKDALIPYINAWVKEVNLETRRMVMTLPAGLLDLDRPTNQEEKNADHE